MTAQRTRSKKTFEQRFKRLVSWNSEFVTRANETKILLIENYMSEY